MEVQATGNSPLYLFEKFEVGVVHLDAERTVLAMNDFARKVLGGLVGPENVLEFDPTMGAEDFSYFLLEKPGCYFLVANGDGSHREGGHGMGPCMLHNPSYDFNDDLIPLGATAWVRLAEAWLNNPRP